MRKSHQRPDLCELQALFRVGTQAGLTDGELLARFISRDGEAAEHAFAALVDRHGPMVFRVCRRVLVDPHKTEDAFQATFLILVRKADTLRDRGSVGNWLYGVAERVAAKARALATRRQHHEGRYAQALTTIRPPDDPGRTDLGALVHQEVGRLPERYRIPVVLCHLEGMTQEEAAARLGWPIGTVRSRLARARERLRGRLSRRGVVPSAAGLVATFAGDASAAPKALVESTVKFATTAGVVPASVDALTQGVLRTMLITKLKIAAALLVALGTAATGAGVLATQDEPDNGPAPKATPKPTEAVPKPSSVGRRPNVGEYLERTRQEVDSNLEVLEAEVADLRAKLAQAETNLRRMQSLKAALTDQGERQNDPGPMGLMSGMGSMMGGNLPYPPHLGQPGMNPAGNDAAAAQANNAQNANAGNGQKPRSADPKGVDRRHNPRDQSEISAAERRKSLDSQIEQLIRERDGLPHLLRP